MELRKKTIIWNSDTESTGMSTSFVVEGYKSVYNEDGDFYKVVKNN